MKSPEGKEVISGLSKEPVFGLGRAVYRDVAFSNVPHGTKCCKADGKDDKGYPILKGLRRGKFSDIEIIEKHIVALKTMAGHLPIIKELDINPLFGHEVGLGIIVADIIIWLELTEEE